MSDEEKPVSLIGTIHIPIKIQGDEKKFDCHISAPGPMAPVEELEKALQRNRDLLDECQKEIAENLRKEHFDREPPWKLNYEGAVLNALVARLNINVLIPLINIKGGKAKFTKIETMPVNKHVEKLMAKAEKVVFFVEPEKNRKGSMKSAILVTAVVAIFVSLYVFMS